jgi:hypothetical protein
MIKRIRGWYLKIIFVAIAARPLFLILLKKKQKQDGGGVELLVPARQHVVEKSAGLTNLYA